MDNSTRRQLLDRARSTGYPGSILDAFTAYEQGRDLIGEFVNQQQQAAMQPQMQVAQTPEEQGQGLRPYHEQGQINQSMAFPNVQPGQSFNTMGMKVPINIDKIDNQGNLVESYKAVPPGIANLPTGPYEGTVIESPARMQKGGFHQKIYNDPLKFAEANRAYNDSLDTYNFTTKGLKKILKEKKTDLGTLIDTSTPYRELTNDQAIDEDYKKWKSFGLNISRKDVEDQYYNFDAKNARSVGVYRFKTASGSDYSLKKYKKPTEEPVYEQLKPIAYKDVDLTKADQSKDKLVREYTVSDLNPKYRKVYDKSPYSVKEYGPEGKFTHYAKEDEKLSGVWRPIEGVPSDLYVSKKIKFNSGGIRKYQTGSKRRDPDQPFFESETEEGTYEAQYSQPEVTITPDWTAEEIERNKLRDEYIAKDKKFFRHWYDKLGYDRKNVIKRANQFAYNTLAKQYLKEDPENLTPEQIKFIKKSEYANRFEPSVGARFVTGLKDLVPTPSSSPKLNLDLNLETLGNLAAPFEYPGNLVRGAVKGEFLDAVKGRTPSPYFVSSDLAGTSPTEASIASGVMTAGTDPLFLTGDEIFGGIGNATKKTYKKGIRGLDDFLKYKQGIFAASPKKAELTNVLTPEEFSRLKQIDEGMSLTAYNSANKEEAIKQFVTKSSLTDDEIRQIFGVSREEIIHHPHQAEPEKIENIVSSPDPRRIDLRRFSNRSEIQPQRMSEADYDANFEDMINMNEELPPPPPEIDITGTGWSSVEGGPDYSVPAYIRRNVTLNNTIDNPQVVRTISDRDMERLERLVDYGWYGIDQNIADIQLDPVSLRDVYKSAKGLFKQRESNASIKAVPSLDARSFSNKKDMLSFVKNQIETHIKDAPVGSVITGSTNTSYNSYLPQMDFVFKNAGTQGLSKPVFLGYKPMNSAGFLSQSGQSTEDVLKFVNSNLNRIQRKNKTSLNLGTNPPYIDPATNDIMLPQYGVEKLNNSFEAIKKKDGGVREYQDADNYTVKQMGGSYQTKQETAMYEWKSGLPEDSRKRYIKGGLKNRVLYNKAKYKR